MYHILVCDDERDIVSALRIYLTAEGYRVLKAYNGKEALAIAGREDVHLILMDIMMPVMDGIQAAKTIRAMNRPDAQKVIILAMTAQTAQECVDECSRSGMDGHIAKPVESRQLVKQILEDM